MLEKPKKKPYMPSGVFGSPSSVNDAPQLLGQPQPNMEQPPMNPDSHIRKF